MKLSPRVLLPLCVLGSAPLFAQTAVSSKSTPAPPSYPRVINLALAADGMVVGDRAVAILAKESAQGNTDLNGDSDRTDVVLHVWDATDESLDNTGLALVTWSGWPEVTRRRVFFTVYEPAQGTTDFNHDGDANDLVLHYVDVDSGNVINLGFAVSAFQTDGNRVAFLVDEAAQGADLNGDLDLNDEVLHLHDAAFGITRNLQVACDSRPHFDLAGDVLAFLVDEQDQGGGDFNGDGDAWDAVLGIHRILANTTGNTALSAHTPLPQFGNDGTIVAILVRESAQGVSLNGDGDLFDEVVHVVDPVTGTVTNLSLAAAEPHVDGGMVAFRAPEDGQGVDFNGDGDLSDQVYHLYRAFPPLLVNTGHAGFQNAMDLEAGRLAFLVHESSDGGFDRNGDGDTDDHVLHLYDIATASTTNLGFDAAQYPEIEAGRVLFTVSESGQNDTDLNGDGDSNDPVLHFYRIVPGYAYNSGIANGPSQFQFSVDGPLAAFLLSEGAQGGLDVNGDGDSIDWVLQLHDTARGTFWSLPIAVRTLGVSGRLVAFIVSEANQGNTDLNGDGDITDEVQFVVIR